MILARQGIVVTVEYRQHSPTLAARAEKENLHLTAPITERSALELARPIRQRELTANEVVEAHIALGVTNTS